MIIRSFADKSTNNIYDYIRSLSSNNLIPQRVQFGTLSATSDYNRASLFNQIGVMSPLIQKVFTGCGQRGVLRFFYVRCVHTLRGGVVRE